MDKAFEHKLDNYLQQLEMVISDDQRLEGYRIYYLASESYPDKTIFAIVKQDSLPLMIDLLCDHKLATNLRAKYESVVPSKLMSETTWNRLICSGQLSEQEIFDLVSLAYQLARVSI